MGSRGLVFFLPSKHLFTVVCQTQLWCHLTNIHSLKPHGIMSMVAIFSLPSSRKGNWGRRIPAGSTKRGRDAVPECALQLQTPSFVSAISVRSEAAIWPVWHAPRLHTGLTQSFIEIAMNPRASLGAQMAKKPPAMQGTWVRSLGWEDPLEEGMPTHSSILAWRIPRTWEPGRLQSMGLQRVGHNWVTKHLNPKFQEE